MDEIDGIDGIGGIDIDIQLTINDQVADELKHSN